MSEPMIRGHVIAHTTRFVRAHLDASASWRFGTHLSDEVKGVLDSIVPAQWYPRHHQVALLCALTEVRGGADAAYGDLLLCGSAMAAVDNPFMTLLMRVMTPELFLKKLPVFWQRDHRDSGAMILEPFDAHSHRGRVTVRDIQGYDHAAVLWLGWIKHVFSSLCAGKAEVDQIGWSSTNSAPNQVVYEMSWS